MQDTLLSAFLTWVTVIAALLTKWNHKQFQVSNSEPGGRFNYFYRFELNAVYASGCLLMLIGVGYFLKQSHNWLDTAVWPKYSAIDGMKTFANADWLVSPVNWVGLYQILDNTPASLAFFLIGLLVTRAAQLYDSGS